MLAPRRLPLPGLLLLVYALSLPSDGSIAAQTPAPGGFSPSFQITGTVAMPALHTLETLKQFPAQVVAHCCIDEKTGRVVDHGYRGVLLWTLIAAAQPVNPNGGAPDSLRSYVLATDPTGFPGIIAMAEVDPALNGRRVIVAFERDGELLDQSLGMAMLVVPDDLTCARDVYWLARLEARYIETR